MKKPKLKVSLLIIFTIFCSVIFTQNLGDISFGTDSTFDVVTWNIEWFPKNGTTTVDSVAKIISSLDADLMGLQEIQDTTLCRQMINNIPGYELFMDDNWFGGLAYVYKTSSINVQSIYKIYDTSPYWSTFPRSPLVMELTFQGEELIVINNHFKCCGDGVIDMGNTSDEEFRRFQASNLLKQYIDDNFSNKRVMVIGDLNDLITDVSPNNVYQAFLDDNANYLFADESIAFGPSAFWSFPNWPSHLDHILVTNELFSDLQSAETIVQTIRVDNYLIGGFSMYDYYISDHRPVGMKIKINPLTEIEEANETNISIFPNPTDGHLSIDLGKTYSETKIKIFNVFCKELKSMKFYGNKLIEFQFDEAPGIYLIMIENGTKKSVVRVIKSNS